MKLKNKINYIAFILLCSCSSNNKWANETIIDSSIKENAIELSAEIEKESYKHIHAISMDVYKDSILIVFNRPNNETKFVEFYNLNTNKKIADYIDKGNANNEMLNCLPHISENKYFVDDFIKKRIAIINIDSVLTNPNYKIPNFIPYSQSNQFTTIYKNNELISLNRYYFEYDKLIIHNNENRFCIQKIEEQQQQVKNNLIDAINVSLGFILVNEKKNRVLYFSSSFAEIEVYDFNLNPIKKVTGPDIIEPEYRIEDNSICYDGIIPLSYMNYYTDENNIYVSYQGYLTKNLYNDKLGSYIFKLDWDGNFIESYHTDNMINNISLTSTKDTFYAFGYDEDRTAVLYKMKINEK